MFITRQIRALPSLVALLVALFAVPAYAIDLDAAKAQGLVGEQPDGYVGIVVSTPSSDVQSMVNEVNAKRKASYREVAQKTEGADLTAVEKLAGQKLISRTPSGQYVKNAQGQWVKK